MEGRDLAYVKERLESIQETEQRLVSFLSSFSKLIDKVHDSHVEMITKDKNDKKSQDFDEFDETDDNIDDDNNNNNNNNDNKDDDVKELINKCYDDLSFSSVHLRRELKLLELKLPLPPNLSKKASDVNNEKLKQLINDI